MTHDGLWLSSSSVPHSASLNLFCNLHFYRLPWSFSWFLNPHASLNCRLCISLINNIFELFSWFLCMADLIRLLDPCHPSHLNLSCGAWFLRNPHTHIHFLKTTVHLISYCCSLSRGICVQINYVLKYSNLFFFYLTYFEFIFCDF